MEPNGDAGLKFSKSFLSRIGRKPIMYLSDRLIIFITYTFFLGHSLKTWEIYLFAVKIVFHLKSENRERNCSCKHLVNFSYVFLSRCLSFVFLSQHHRFWAAWADIKFYYQWCYFFRYRYSLHNMFRVCRNFCLFYSVQHK